MVHSGIRFRMRIGIDLRLSPGRMAIRCGRSDMGGSCSSALVDEIFIGQGTRLIKAKASLRPPFLEFRVSTNISAVALD